MKTAPVIFFNILLAVMIILTGCTHPATDTGTRTTSPADTARPAGLASGSPAPTTSPSAVAHRDPVEAVRAFTGNASAVIRYDSNITSINGKIIDVYQMGRDRFYLDSDTGTVMGATFLSLPIVTTGPYTNETAEPVAQAYAAKHYTNFESRHMILSSKTLDHGAGEVEYQYTWNELKDGVDIGNLVMVSVNPAGQVIIYQSFDTPVPHFEPATITSDEANATAVNFVISSWHIRNITSIKSSPPRLVLNQLNRSEIDWIVELKVEFRSPLLPQGKDYHGGIAAIDARNGTLISFDGYL